MRNPSAALTEEDESNQTAIAVNQKYIFTFI